MQRLMLCLRLAAGLAALAAVPSLAAPAHSASSPSNAGRHGRLTLPVAPQTVTVVRPGGHGWFIAADWSGRRIRVSLPPRFGSVQRDGELVPTERLRSGDRVDVWGLPHGGHIQAARVRVATGETTADNRVRRVSEACCGACASCASCASGCAGCESRSDCQSCCGAACCPSPACCV